MVDHRSEAILVFPMVKQAMIYFSQRVLSPKSRVRRTAGRQSLPLFIF